MARLKKGVTVKVPYGLMTPLRWQECLTRRDRLEAIARRMDGLSDWQAAVAWRYLMQFIHRYNDPGHFRKVKFNDLLIDILRAGVKARHNALSVAHSIKELQHRHCCQCNALIDPEFPYVKITPDTFQCQLCAYKEQNPNENQSTKSSG